VIGFVALLAPVVATHDPSSGVLADALQGPSAEHWLGTDHLGRDELSRLVFGARISLLAGLEAVAIGVLIGVPTGLLAGFRKGWFDRITMRVVEVAVSLPVVVVAIAIVAATGPGVGWSMVAVGLVAATIMARLTRSVVLVAGEEEYVDGARVAGASDLGIIVRHLLPNVGPAIVVQATLLLAAAVLAEAALSFLGLGAVPPEPSWGVMLDQAREQLDEAPWLAVWPGLCIFLTILAFNLLGDRGRDVLGRGRAFPLTPPPLERIEQPDQAAAPPARDPTPALELRHVSVTFDDSGRTAPAVSDASLSIGPHEVLGLVGESGAGKSTLALAALGLVPHPGRVQAASIIIAGTEIVGLPPAGLCRVRGRLVGFVAQEPASALDPTQSVGRQLAEPLRWHLDRSRRQARHEAGDLLERVGIGADRLDDYPFQLSGGEAQRIAIAMALACRPAVLIADEPTTALDAVTQAQLLDLLVDLRDDFGTAILLITHDLGVVAGVADRVAVMHQGRIIEIRETASLFADPRQPYTKELLDSALHKVLT
jgi:peptide/nickel transport system permease protein